MVKEMVVAARISEELNEGLLQVCNMEGNSPSHIIRKAIELYVQAVLRTSDSPSLDAKTVKAHNVMSRMNKSMGRSNSYGLYPKDDLGKYFLSLAGKKRFGSVQDMEKWQFIIGVFYVGLTPDDIKKRYHYWHTERGKSKYSAVRCVLNQLYSMAQEEETTTDIDGSRKVSEQERTSMVVKEMYKRMGFDVDEMDACFADAVLDREQEIEDALGKVDAENEREAVADIREIHRKEIYELLVDVWNGNEIKNDVITMVSAHMVLPEPYVTERLKELAESGCLEIMGAYITIA